MTSYDQVRRLLAEVPYLRAHPGVKVSEVATTFGITSRQVLKDLNVLWMCGLPGRLPGDLIDIDMDAVEGEGVIRLSNADYLSRPMRFTADEATSLVMALTAIQELATGELAGAAARAAEKLRRVVPQAGDERVAIQLASGGSVVRDTVRRAIESKKRLRLEYDNASRGETTHPVVDPAVIEVREGIAYLHAWSITPGAWRIFRVERIAAAEFTGGRAEDHGDPPRDHDWLDEGTPQVTLDLAPQAQWVVEYYPTVNTRSLSHHVLRATFRVGYPDWITTLLLRLGPGVLRVDPPGVSGEARRRATQALELYGSL